MKFEVKGAPDLAYMAHQMNIGRRQVWCSSLIGRDGGTYSSEVASSEGEAKTRAKQRAEEHGAWPKGQKACLMWTLSR